MSVSSKAEGEASKKGLSGAAKRQYVGGAIHRARQEKAEGAKRLSDDSFAEAVSRAVAKRENGSGFATFPQVREELRRETGLSDAAINNRLRKLRDEGDAGRAPITLHFEPDEDRMHIARRGQLTWRGHDFDFISVLPSVQEQKRRDIESMQRVRQEEADMFRAHGMTPPVRDPKTGKVLRPAQPIKAQKQQHSYHREAMADALSQIRYHEAQIAGLREGMKQRRELAGASKPKPKKREPKPEPTALVPIRSFEGMDFDPSAPVNPYLLRDLYGEKQLGRALDRYTVERLRPAVQAVQAKHPGTRPHGQGKAAMVSYIQEYIDKPPTPRAAPVTRPQPKPARPKRAPDYEQTRQRQIAAAGGLVPKTPLDKLRKMPVREMSDAQLLRDWENHPPERRRGVLEREMARRHAKAEKAQQPKPAQRRRS